LKKLAELSKNDNILRVACNAVVSGSLNTLQFSELVELAKQKTTEAEQVAVFEDAIRVNGDVNRRVIPRKKRAALLSVINNLAKLNTGDVVTWETMEIDKDQIATLRQQLTQTIHILQTLLTASG
jgi:hypothetical protein